MRKLLALFLIAGMFTVSSCASTTTESTESDMDTTSVVPTETPADNTAAPIDSTSTPATDTTSNK